MANGYAVIWDMDGTLVDTAELHYQAWVALAGELDKPFSREDFFATFGRRNPEIFGQLFPGAFEAEEVARLGDRKEELYKAAARRQGVVLLPGVRTLLENLHVGYRQAVGSSALRGNLELILQLTDVKGFFDALVSMEDTRRGKPDPEVFLIAAEKLGVAPARCVVVEDAVAGVEAAKAGGMKAVAVRFVGHHGEAALTRAGADLVVENLEQVSVETIDRLLGCA